MLITYTSAFMQPSDVSMRALAYEIKNIIYMHNCESSGATRALYYVLKMTKSTGPAHANAYVDQIKPTRDLKGSSCTTKLCAG
eukprot:6213799-Pleurochrysis_carterae.AAC.8